MAEAAEASMRTEQVWKNRAQRIPARGHGAGADSRSFMSEENNIPADYASHVRSLYEEYPFPLRDPQDENRRLVVAEQEAIGKLNHFCYSWPAAAPAITRSF